MITDNTLSKDTLFLSYDDSISGPDCQLLRLENRMYIPDSTFAVIISPLSMIIQTL